MPPEIERTTEAKCSSAEICRRNGWKIGARLIERDPILKQPRRSLQITAIGVRHVLAIEITNDSTRRDESQWDLTIRDWMEILN